MRSRLMIGAGVLLLASRMAMAQTAPKPQPQAPAAPGPTVPSLGSIDFGFRGTDTDLDAAQYERYRDLRSGAASLFALGKETASYFFDASAFNVGYRDQQYKLRYDRHKLNFGFLWDSIPTNYSELTVSPWTVGDNAVLTISRCLAAAGAEPNGGRCSVRAGRAAGGVQQPDAGGRRARPTDRFTTRTCLASRSGRDATRRRSGWRTRRPRTSM